MKNYSYSLDIGKEFEKELDKKQLKEVLEESEQIEKKEQVNNEVEIHITENEISKKLENIDNKTETTNHNKIYFNKINKRNLLFRYKFIIILIIILIVFFIWNNYGNENTNNATNKNINIKTADKDNLILTYSNKSYNNSTELKETLIKGLI